MVDSKQTSPEFQPLLNIPIDVQGIYQRSDRLNPIAFSPVFMREFLAMIWCNSNIYSVIPTRMWGPANGSASAHQADEFFELESLFEAICELIRFVVAWGGIGRSAR